MAFKNVPPAEIVPESPEEILLTLSRRKIPGVLLHQGEMMRTYASQAINDADVALQLPTGSGKTLVGLMIAEWRRRKFRQRIVYLCPTRQLVNQVVEQASSQYGLTVNGFTGSKAEYSPTAKAEYQNADRIAVTTYSSLFNTSPFFSNPDVVIVDDAHAAENYVAETWTVRIQRTRPEHRSLFQALTTVLAPHLDRLDLSRMKGRWDDSSDDRRWVDKLPTPAMIAVADELAAVMDAHVDARCEVGVVDDTRPSACLSVICVRYRHSYKAPRSSDVAPFIVQQRSPTDIYVGNIGRWRRP